MFGNVRGVLERGSQKGESCIIQQPQKSVFLYAAEISVKLYKNIFHLLMEKLQSGTKICLEFGILAVLSTTKFFMQNFLLMIQFPLWLEIAFLSAILCNLCHGLRERKILMSNFTCS